MADISLNYLLTGTDKSASKTMQNTATVGQKVAGQIGGAFKGLGNTIGGEVGDLLNRVGDGIEKLGEKGTTAGQKMSIVGAGVAGLGVALMSLGSANVAADKQLEATFTAAGKSMEDYKGQIDDLVQKNVALGHSDDDVKLALSTLTQSLGDPQKAIKNMGLVADYAASRHENLQQASLDLGKALVGSSTRAFSQYGITVKKTGDRTKNLQDATDELGKKLKGQASASTDTFLGKVNALKTGMGNWVGDMSAKYGPGVTAFGTVIMAAGAAMQIWKAIQEAGTVAAVAGKVATVAGSVATGVATAAQWAFNAAMDANPIAIVILAVAALVAGLIWFFTQTKLGKEIWENVTHAIGVAIAWIGEAIGTIGKVAGDVWNNVVSAFRNAWNGIVSFFKGVINNGIIGPLESAINWITDLINGITKGVNSVSGAFGMPKIPAIQHVHIARLAQGALITGSNGGVPVVAGDGGKSEIVTNKDQMASFVADALKQGGAGGQTDLSDSTIDRLARAIAGYSRGQGRMGIA